MKESNITKITPLQRGSKTTVIITVTDEDKAFDFFGKAVCGRLDTSEYGFNVEQLYFTEDRYKEVMPEACRKELIGDLDDFYREMKESIENKIK
jgi:hypothetical protein